MKAIETIYKGYRFRSRLEARWAVFFDTLEVPYEYERQGYTLDDGTNYLPDFWLPSVGKGCFVEIKPGEMAPDEQHKAEQLALSSRQFVMCVCGNPWPGEHSIYEFCRKTVPHPIITDALDRCINDRLLWLFLKLVDEHHDFTDQIGRMNEAAGINVMSGLMSRVRKTQRVFSWCEQHGLAFGSMFEDSDRCAECGNKIPGKPVPAPRCFAASNDPFEDCEPYTDGPALMRAFSAARSARFEHGETPG